MAVYTICRKGGFIMNNKARALLSAIFILIVSNLASAYIIRDVQAARQAELDSFEQYKTDFIKFNDLEAFSPFISERNLASEFGFHPASYYYVPPNVLAAKYNPPLQGVAYSTSTRGYTSSLNQPSAVKYYGEQINGRYTGYIPSKVGSTYFDHPQMNGGQDYLLNSYQASTYPYSSNDYSTDYSSVYSSDYNGYNDGYDYNEPAYSGTSFSGDNYGIYANSGHDNSYSNYAYGYGYGNYQDLDSYDTNTGEPAFYARIAERTTGGFYVVGYY
jgi:hypothetical protein